MNRYEIEYTDTFGGEANYCWVKRFAVHMPEITNYGYDGAQGYKRAHRTYRRELMRKAKRAAGLTNVRGVVEPSTNGYTFKPYGSNTILIISGDN